MQIKFKNRIISSFLNRRGFTLIEILIALALTGLIMSSVYAIYIANIRAVRVDEQRVEIQQAQRFSMDLIMRELRHAGYDLEETDLPTIEQAGANYIYFTADLYGCDTIGCATPTAPSDPFPDGNLDDPGEHIVFCVYDGNSLGYFTTDDPAEVGDIDADNDGFADAGHTHTLPSHQEVSVIENIEFYYTLSDGTRTTTPSDAQLDSIRSIDISILSRAEDDDPQYTSTAQSFTTASGVVWDGFNDNLRRTLMTSTIRLRNMGL